MRNRETLITTYIVEMFKICQVNNIKRGGLKDVKVTVELAYHEADGSKEYKKITGFTKAIVAGLRVLDKHQQSGVPYEVQIKDIQIEK